MHIMCMCCKRSFDDDKSAAFHEDSIINSVENYQILTLQGAIELITDRKIPNMKNVIFCNTCFQKVGSYLNLRSQLIASIGLLIDTRVSNNLSGLLEYAKDTPRTVRMSNTETEVSIWETNINSTLENSSFVKNGVESSNFWSFLKSPSYQQDDNFSYSETSNDSSDIDISRQPALKIQENDIESEIDVCSGEDDEILELDIQCTQNKAIDISSSSESDIEVCDYEPTSKRFKGYSSVSPAVYF